MRDSIMAYLRHKRVIWLLFDNVDKGWPAHGLRDEDLLIVRTLIEATRKLEAQLTSRKVDVHTVVFLRNDVYELLIDATPDRGKDTRASLDWTDADMLRELIRRRMAADLEDDGAPFEALWRDLCTSHVDGEETSEYLIDRSLMRPRFLIDLLSHCRGFAVNLGHERIQPDDIRKALTAYSTDLLTDVGYEIRDVFPDAADVVYAFIECEGRLGDGALRTILGDGGIADADLGRMIELLLWYGFLGLAGEGEEITYIYSARVNYSMQLLRAHMKRMLQSPAGVRYAINPAFWPGLGIRH